MRRVFVAFCLVGCTSAPVDLPASDPIPFVMDIGGVQLSGSALRIDFGRTDHSAVPAMTKLVGSDPVSRHGCPGGATRVVWPDGNQMIFQGGDFVGWIDADGRSAGAAC